MPHEVPTPGDIKTDNVELRLGLAEDRVNDVEARLEAFLGKVNKSLDKVLLLLWGMFLGLVIGIAIGAL